MVCVWSFFAPIKNQIEHHNLFIGKSCLKNTNREHRSLPIKTNCSLTKRKIKTEKRLKLIYTNFMISFEHLVLFLRTTETVQNLSAILNTKHSGWWVGWSIIINLHKSTVSKVLVNKIRAINQFFNFFLCIWWFF